VGFRDSLAAYAKPDWYALVLCGRTDVGAQDELIAAEQIDSDPIPQWMLRGQYRYGLRKDRLAG
jgi:hypothetical protein